MPGRSSHRRGRDARRRSRLAPLAVGVLCASLATAVPIDGAAAAPTASAGELSQQRSAELDRLLTSGLPSWSGLSGALDAAGTALKARMATTPAGPLSDALSDEAAKLEVASKIVAAAASATDPLSLAVSAVREATEAQVEYLGASFPVLLPQAADPAAAAFALAERHDRELTPEERGRILALDQLPDPLRSALGSVLWAYGEFDRFTTEAYADVDPVRLDRAIRALEAGAPSTDTTIQGPRQRDGSPPQDSSRYDSPPVPIESLGDLGVDLGPVMAARALLLDAVVGLRDAMSASSQAAAGTVPPVDLCPVLAVHLDPLTNDYYGQDCFLVVDAGGNDSYYNNAGGNGINVWGYPCPILASPFNAAALVDLGGHDRYESYRSCGQGGGAYLGSGFLLDVGTGDYDVYSHGDYGTNGGGYLGAGFLLDAGGYSNQVNGGSWATNGGGVNGGSGLLYDGASVNYHNAWGLGSNGGGYLSGVGTDIGTGTVYSAYNATGLGTNGGGCQGSGLLINLGDDNGGGLGAGWGGTNGGGRGSYCNYNTGTTAGSGLLVAGEYGQQGLYGDNGAGIEEGVGMLIGGTGNAGYSGGNGTGGWGGIGFLVEPAGNDGYGGWGNGGGWSIGEGLLLDMAGNDYYSASWGGTNGGGLDLGSGFLLDAVGNDVYSGADYGSNGGGAVEGSGFLHDLAGNDGYGAGTCGVNGGGPTGGCGGVGSGTLLDGAGDDGYYDGDGGTGQNKTVALKGTVGRQIDVTSMSVPGTVGEVAFRGTAFLPTFPCPPPPPFGTGPCAGNFTGDWSADVSGVSGTSAFHAVWNTTSGTAVNASFQYSEWQCLTATESILGLAVGSGTATVAPGGIQGKWQQPNTAFPLDIVGATMTFDFEWTRVLGTAVLTLKPLSLVLDVAGLPPQTVVTGEQNGIATFVVTSTDNTAVPSCDTPLTDVEGVIAGTVSLAS